MPTQIVSKDIFITLFQDDQIITEVKVTLPRAVFDSGKPIIAKVAVEGYKVD